MTSETDIEHELRQTLGGALAEPTPVPDLAQRVSSGLRRSGRRRRAAGLGLVVLVVATTSGGIALRASGDHDRVAAPTQTPTPAPTGCERTTVQSVETADDDLTVTLLNSGPTACDLSRLNVSVTLGGFDLADRASADDFASPAHGLPTDGTAAVRIGAQPGCQFGGARFTIRFTDATALEFTHPGAAGVECIQPTPRLDLATIDVAGDDSTSVDGAGDAGTGIEGTWTLSALVGADGQALLPKDYDGNPSMTFTDGEMSGTTGCNSMFGPYEQGGRGGEDLRFPPDRLGTTQALCPDEVPLWSRLFAVRHVSGGPGVRYLHAENWMIVAVLRSATGE